VLFGVSFGVPFGVPFVPFVSFVSFGVPFGVTFGIPFGVTFGVPFGVPLGVLFVGVLEAPLSLPVSLVGVFDASLVFWDEGASPFCLPFVSPLDFGAGSAGFFSFAKSFASTFLALPLGVVFLEVVFVLLSGV
jgi:hypothetical protein